MKQQITQLTGLRFVAAFYVFLFHINIRYPLSENVYVKNFLDQGAVGMSVFFILSGFVLAYQYAENDTTLKNFFINRFARIYPIYALSATLCLPWIGVHIESDHIFLGLSQFFLIIISNIFLIQAWFPQFFSHWNDGGSWSISVEAFCYILLPFLLRNLSEAKKVGAIKFIYLLAFILAILPGLSAYCFPGQLNNVFYSMPIFRLPEFVIGICIYLIHSEKNQMMNISSFLMYAILIIYICYLGIYGPSLPIYVAHNWITLPVISLIIFFLLGEKNMLSKLLSSDSLVFLGKISYCFYSFQVILILLLVDYHDKLSNKFFWLHNNKILLIISFVVLLIASCLGYYLVEEPARKTIKRYGNEKLLPS